MKKTNVLLFVVLFASMVTFGLLSISQGNYELAVSAARNSEGTDAAIEETMYQYGFEVEALDPNEPSMVEKIKAIFK